MTQRPQTLYQIDIRYRGQGTSLPIDITPEDFAKEGLAGLGKRFDDAFPARAFVGSGTLLRGCRFEMMGTARR